MKDYLKIFWISMLLFNYPAYTGASERAWKTIIEEVKPSVLMIEIENLSKLENETPGCYQATGFIVDSERGIILTNRHVTVVGPSTTRATFWNKEKIEIKPLYEDPIHDFGFYSFDPSLLRWTKPKALRLADSDKAAPGEEIRVLGNNASEGFSILEGTLSRTNRNAPLYSDTDSYRDFNTYYFQTSADVSGGSSGGPIINRQGEVIAINSSSKTYTTVSWGLPVNVIKPSFEALKHRKSIRRGDMGARIIFSSFDELLDYGFPKSLIAQLKKRNPDMEGLLTVQDTLPKTDAQACLKPADVIWEADGVKINDSFQRLEEILNLKIGQSISLKVIREGRTLEFKIRVNDLERARIKSFVRIGYDYFSPIPIFLAYNYNVPLEGVFTPSIKYNFSEKTDFPTFILIKSLGGKPVKSVSDFMEALEKTKTSEKIKMVYDVLKEEHREEQKVFEINWKWFVADYFKLDESKHEWIKVN